MAPGDAAIESPCVRVCVIDQATGYCCGCYRTLDEISFWIRYTPEERKRVMQHLQARRAVAAGIGITE
jgi:predicted Fe-S protein YdhL (DUF1289 family)